MLGYGTSDPVETLQVLDPPKSHTLLDEPFYPGYHPENTNARNHPCLLYGKKPNTYPWELPCLIIIAPASAKHKPAP